jgi:act minimal PKS acyl carrier protein
VSGERITVDELLRILTEVAGAPDSEGGAAEVDAELDYLGYDSLAVLAAVAKIEREFGVKIDEEKLPEAKMLSDVVELVNAA